MQEHGDRSSIQGKSRSAGRRLLHCSLHRPGKPLGGPKRLPECRHASRIRTTRSYYWIARLPAALRRCAGP